MTEHYRHIGVSTPRKDARAVVTGGARYLADLSIPGMLHGAVLRSPHPHARIARIDLSKALAHPGVVAALTHKDVPDWRVGTPKVVRVLGEKVFFVGDGVALVAARTEEAAKAALDLIEVDYEVLPAAFSMNEALAIDAPLLHSAAPGNVITGGTNFFGPTSLTGVRMGDVEAGFASADAVVEGECGFGNLPNPLAPEPPGVIARWEAPAGVTVWMSTQGPHQDRMMLTHAFGRAVDVRVIGGPCGGSYGSKFMTLQLALQAAALSRKAGAPVRLILSKEEQLSGFTLRLESKIKARVGLAKDGTITALAGEWLVGTGAYSVTTQAQIAVGCGELQLVVRAKNWDLSSKVVCANRPPSGIVRGFGGQELKCALLPIISRGLEKLAIDPFAFYRKNYLKPGDKFFWRDGREYTYRGIDYTPAMDEGARVFGWKQKWKGWLKPTEVRGSLRTGVGVGVHGNVDVGESVSEAQLRLDPQGCATLLSAATEHGTGQPSNLVKMAAEVLNLPLERIALSDADTATTPFDFGPVGSRGTYAMGSAVILAAEDALEQLYNRAAPLLGAPVEELATEDGSVFVKSDQARRISWSRVIGMEGAIYGQGRFNPDFTLANCMMTFIEAQVDTPTGLVRISRVVNATDAGCVIDPPGLTNQFNGCFGSAGIDGALMEETIVDRRTGRVMNANLIDYKWRTFSDLPPIAHAVGETPMPTHRFGAIGVGEVATAPGPTALIMAVSNALGTHLDAYPLTPEKILKALEKAGIA